MANNEQSVFEGPALSAQARDRAVELIGTEEARLRLAAGPWSRNAAMVLRAVGQLVLERAPGFTGCSSFAEWFAPARFEVLARWHREDTTASNRCSPYCGRVADDVLMQLAGDIDPAFNPEARAVMEKQFAAVSTLLAPLAAQLDTELLSAPAAPADEGAIERAMLELDELVGRVRKTPRERVRLLAARFRGLVAVVGEGLRPPALRAAAVRLGGGACSVARAQIAGIRSELSRSLRPPVRIEVLKDFGVSLRRASRYGGDVTLVPIRNSSGNQTLGTSVTGSVPGGYGVRIHTDGSLLPNGRTAEGQRWVLWEMGGLQDAETARHVAKRIEDAMIRSVGGGRSPWPVLVGAGVAGLIVMGVLVAGPGPRPSREEGPVAAAPASSTADAALAALFSKDAVGGGVDPQVMAQILAGAGVEAPSDGQADPWMAQVLASAAQASQETRAQAGVPGVPLEDPAMKDFGLGMAPAGCDPALRFKVAE
ncbi:hypothetical protein [Pseudoxanthomonas kaohsiungensis]|uniref:Uncharacterized protein n=1 Tax=Pseudoxanthomonas kaohsiungensis TaxID=283923 RepID=A0ABW3M0T1_9GAMM|nr:hypothetical protein [Pseudoxanthomonas kaohsiungensis]KAF1702929.1 hypothetical protein CSC66_09140 [Pseudoxanthomonas kaohsiungensis]